MEIRFVPDAPGAWLVYDLGGLVLALPPEFRAAADAVAASSRSGIPDVIAALRASGIAASAPFALLEWADGGVRVALRGPATVAAGADTLTGLGAERWLERRLPGVAIARLTVPGGEWTFSLGGATAVVEPEERAEAVAADAAEETVVVPVGPPPLLDARQEVTEVPGLEHSTPTPGPTAADAATSAEDSTVVVDEIAQLRAKRSAGIAPPILSAPVVAPAVPAPAPGPRLSLELPDGLRQPIDYAVLVGRSPGLPDGIPTRVLRFADGDISRNHARIAAEGGTVVVTDLGSRNGTTVRIPGRPAQKLRGHEPTPVLPGTVIDFGGGIELIVRED
jgi:hypothetical protein